MFENIIQVQIQAGAPLEIDKAGDSPITIVPLSKMIMLNLPIVNGVWSRPIGAEVNDGQNHQRLPITDITRIVQLGLYGLSALFSVVTLIHLVSTRKA